MRQGVRFEPGAFLLGRGDRPVAPSKSSVDCNGRQCYPDIMLSCRCEAIVLGMMDYREADKIVTLFTLEQGKIKGMARGAKRSVRRFGGALELFARLKLEIGIKEGLAQLHTADIVSVFPRIREDLAKIGHAGYACELTDALLPEGACNPRLFRLLTSYLEYLERFPAASSDRRFFELNLLNVLGLSALPGAVRGVCRGTGRRRMVSSGRSRMRPVVQSVRQGWQPGFRGDHNSSQAVPGYREVWRDQFLPGRTRRGGETS